MTIVPQGSTATAAALAVAQSERSTADVPSSIDIERMLRADCTGFTHVSTVAPGLPASGRVVKPGATIADWKPVAQGLPDDELLVLIALNDDDVWTGFRDGEIWRYVDSMPIAAERVTHWAHLPAHPGVA